jgi:hypothetical protein
MGRKSRRAGGRAQLGARQSLSRVMHNTQLGAKNWRQQHQQDEPWWMRSRQPGAK